MHVYVCMYLRTSNYRYKSTYVYMVTNIMRFNNYDCVASDVTSMMTKETVDAFLSESAYV